MDRMNEYQALLQALSETPPALEGSVARAKAKDRRRRAGRWCGIPMASLGGLAAAFVLLVNFSLPFARACGNIPFLKDLAAAVAFSPSLKAAVEHDYVQPIGQSQTVNDVTMTVEYLIVDQKQVNIFFSLKSDAYTALWGDPEVLEPDGETGGRSVGWRSPEDGSGLQQVVVNYLEGDTPDALTLRFKVMGDRERAPDEPIPAPDALSGSSGEPLPEREYVAEFTFDLDFDPPSPRRERLSHWARPSPWTVRILPPIRWRSTPPTCGLTSPPTRPTPPGSKGWTSTSPTRTGTGMTRSPTVSAPPALGTRGA